MARKLSLPTLGPATDLFAPPTVDAVRARLGGRVSPGPRATEHGEGANGGPRSSERIGEVVRLGMGEPLRLGVLLADEGEVVDVLVERGTVRRTSRHEVSPWIGEASDELTDAAAAARAFGALNEGATVTFAARGRPPEAGTLVEKCRWGGLVQRSDGVVVGVGFRRIAAAAEPTSRS